jgi:hypothetical protein
MEVSPLLSRSVRTLSHLFLLVSFMAGARAQTLFTDVTTSAVGMPRHGNAIVVDIDNDGVAEMVVGTDSTRLWKKQGAFNYTDITDAAGLQGVVVVSVADFNNDGFVDFLHTKASPVEAFFYRNNKDGTFSKVSLPLAETQYLTSAQELRAADIDGDGDLDLVFGRAVGSTGSIVCILNQSRNGTPADQPFSGVTTLALTPWKHNKAEVTDANNDGKPDLLSIRTTGDWSSGTHPDFPVTLFLNTGSSPADYLNADASRSLAGFTRIDNCGISAANVMSPLASWDIDNDGDQDLINGSSDWPSSSRTHIYVNDGNGNYTQMNSPVYQSTRYYHHWISIFDADLDNDMDAVWTGLHNFADTYPRMWRNDGDLAFSDVTSSWGITARIPGSGNHGMGGYHADLDEDGDLDFVVDMSNGWGSEKIYAVYRNNAVQNGANWLGVRLVSGDSAPNGIGARVEVTVNGRKLTQLMLDITGGVRNLSSLRFGLGSSATATSVKVYWPSGQITELQNVQGNRVLSIDESTAPSDSDNDGVNDYREGKDGTDPNDPLSFNPLSKRLVAYYPFEGDANDESGYANHGVVNGAALTSDRAGRTNTAYFFDGSSFITGGNIIPNYKDGATLSCWVKSSHVGLTQGALCKPRPYGDYGGFSIGISASSGFAYGGLNTDPYYGALQGGVIANRAVFSSSSIADERWQHLLATVDGASLKFYLNGMLVGIEYFVSDPISSDRLLQIGREGQGGPQYGPRWFLGSVDEVRVYDRALSEAEIGQLYEAEAAGLDSDNDGVTDYRERRDGTNPLDSSSFEGLSKNLVAHYPFDGSTLDESGYANHAVNKGATDSADRFGAASSAYDFNGVDAYMDAPPLVSDYQRNFTMSGWIKTTHVSSDRLDAAVSALSKTRDAGDFGGPAIDFREGKAVFAFNNNRVYGDLIPFEEWEYATTDLLADGNWRHYIMSIDANGLITAFINGQQVASHQIATFLEVAGASPFQIGRAGGAHEAGRYFPGQIDEVRVYNRGLTAEEAAMLYRESVCGLDSDADGVTDYRERRDGTNPYDVASFEPLSVALIANYPFDNSWKDESGYCRDVLAPYTTFEPGLLGSSLGLAEGNSQANYWNDPNNIESPGRINNFTFSVWMKPATLEQADGTWYHLVSAPNNAAYLRIGNAVGAPGAKVLGMGYSWSGIPGFDYSTPALTSLQESFWQHVVGVQQGVSTAIYINGRLVGSLAEGQEILFDPENFTIGNLFNKDTSQGHLDEVRIYGRALSPAEVGALYALEVGDLDSDNDGLDDVHETNTGTFVSATDAGTDPYNPDTSGDGILDGEAVLWNFNPLTDHTQVLAFLRHATGVQSGRFALYTEGSIMDLNLGGVMLQKSGNQASVRFKVESKMDLRDPSWTDRGTYLLPPIDMPGSKGFLRIRAEQP